MSGWSTLWLLTGLAAVPLPQAASNSAGSHLPRGENACATCHTEPELWSHEKQRLFLSADKLAADVHWRKGVNCHDCHGGNPRTTAVNEAHAAEDHFRAKGPRSGSRVPAAITRQSWTRSREFTLRQDRGTEKASHSALLRRMPRRQSTPDPPRPRRELAGLCP